MTLSKMWRSPVRQAIPDDPGAVAKPMITPIAQEPPKVWAMRDVDLEPVIAWLHPALSKKWPRCMESSLRFWLKSAMRDRMTHIVCSENVCAMVHVVADVKEPEPRVFENFLRGNDKATEEERQMVYDHLTSWCAAIGAREFHFNMDSDARMTRSSSGPGATNTLQDDRINRNVKSRPTFAVVFKSDD